MPGLLANYVPAALARLEKSAGAFLFPRFCLKSTLFSRAYSASYTYIGSKGARGSRLWLQKNEIMKNIHYAGIKLFISFIISGSLIFAGTSLLRYFDPTFSVSLFDLLAQINPTAWLLLALLAGLIFAGLSALPTFSSEHNPTDERHRKDSE